MATPHVAGAWALLKQVKPTATVDEVLAALRSTALPIYDPSGGLYYKRIKIRDAVGALTNLSLMLSADQSAPQPAYTTISFTATSTGGVGTTQYKWQVFDGMTWAVAQDWSTTNTFAWTPTAPNNGHYVSVWGRSATISGNAADGAAAMKSMAFTIAPLPPAVLTAVTTDKSAPQTAGTTITFTAAAGSGKAPYQFKWWVNDGTTWMLLQDWSATATIAWTPTVANAAYKLSTWVRSSGNPADTYEGYQFTNFAITLPPPATVSVIADKTPPQTRGTTITFTAAAASGSAPYQFKWWLNTDGGPTWMLLQDWSA